MSEVTEQEKEIETETPIEVDGHSLAVIGETVTDLAPMGAEEGKAIIEARKQIVDAAARASIALTHPEDWVLFRDEVSGRVTAYLQDSGCKRIMPIWGIQIPSPSTKRIEQGGDFAYVLSGDAFCTLTKTWYYGLKGIRTSKEHFLSQVKDPLLKEIRVEEAARANLDGNAVRRAAGLQNIPEPFLNEVWQGSNKTTGRCSKGRGFGTKEERQGTAVRTSGTPDVTPPICDSCGSQLQFIPAGSNDRGTWEAYWRCREYKYDSSKKVSNGHSRVPHTDWQKTLAAKAAAAPADEPLDPGPLV